MKIVTLATSLPAKVIGTTSPYPMVPTVTIAHHMASGILPKLVRLGFAFNQMHDRRGHQRRGKDDHKTAEKRAPLRVKRVEQRTHASGIPHQFQKANDAKNQNDAKIGG